MEKLEDLSYQGCFICHEYIGSEFRNEFSDVTTYSERSLYTMFGKFDNSFKSCCSTTHVLESLAGFKLSEEIIMSSGVCQNCFIKLNELDEHQTVAKRIEAEILTIYHTSYEEADVKYAIKNDNEEDYSIVEVMLDNNEYSEESEACESNIVKQIKTDTKRSYRKKKDLDKGLTIIEVDGGKIYQCEICKKTCKDRYRLKSHREIHSTERTVCCNECGAMFKTLTCLYSHKKIHKERIYHQWLVYLLLVRILVCNFIFIVSVIIAKCATYRKLS